MWKVKLKVYILIYIVSHFCIINYIVDYSDPITDEWKEKRAENWPGWGEGDCLHIKVCKHSIWYFVLISYENNNKIIEVICLVI